MKDVSRIKATDKGMHKYVPGRLQSRIACDMKKNSRCLQTVFRRPRPGIIKCARN